jgi:hypothetical protein
MEGVCFLYAMFPCAQRVYAAIAARHDVENRQAQALAVSGAMSGGVNVAELQ